MLGENVPEPLQLCHTFLFVIFSFPFPLFILGFALLPMQLPFNSCIALSYIFQAFGSPPPPPPLLFFFKGNPSDAVQFQELMFLLAVVEFLVF